MTEIGSLVEFASDAAFAVGADLRIVAWNRHAAELLGYTAEEAVGQRCSTIVAANLPHGEPLCSARCAPSLCFGRCQPYAIEACRARRKDGSWLTLSISSMAVPQARRDEGDGQRVAAIIFLRAAGEAAAGRRMAQDLPMRIFTLGHFGLAIGDRGVAIENWERKQAIVLLKLLSRRVGVVVPRDELIECLWPNSDPDGGRDRIKVTAYFLRRKLKAAGLAHDLIKTQGNGYLLKRDGVWIDAESFEQLAAEGTELLRQGKPEAALSHFEDSQNLYRGDYMAEDPYADWCAEERGRLHEVYLDMSTAMAEAYGKLGRFALAAQVCRKALVREPCRESLHRALMEYFLQLGRPDWAMAQYRHCEQVLATELGVAPMKETSRLYEIVMAQSAGGALRSKTV